MADKPSFLTTLKKGTWGYIKGSIAGGLVGIIAGAAIGAVIGFFAGGVGAVAGATLGAAWGGGLMASIGAITGTATEVVKTRSANLATREDVVNMAKISVAQSVALSHQMAQEQAAGPGFREREAARRAQAAQQSQQLH